VTCEQVTAPGGRVYQFRLVHPDGTDHPPYEAIVTGVRTDDPDVIHLFGGLGCWGEEWIMLWERVQAEGFDRVVMTRHGKTRTHRIDDLIRHS